MNLRPCKAAHLATVLALLVASAAAPQSPASQGSSSDSTSNPAKTPAAIEKVKLIEATRVSTEEAARRAAQDKAKGTSRPAAKKDSEKYAPSGVSELQPVSKAAGDSEAAVRVSPEDSGKPLLRNIHGSAQGAGSSGTRQGGAEVGAKSKNGKMDLYVETEKSRSDPATPH